MKIITANFDLRGTSADYNKLVITVTNTSGETPDDICDVYIKLENGYIIKDFGATADIASLALDGTETYKISLPIVSGDVLKGSYTLSVKFVNINDSNDVVTQTASYNLTTVVGTTIQPMLSHVVDCVAGLLVVQDDTEYGNVTVTDKTIVIDNPVIPNVGDTPNVTFTGSQAVVEFKYTNVNYVATLNFGVATTGSESNGITFSVSEIGTSQLTAFIECGDCEITKCVHDTISSLRAKARNRGGIANLDTSEQSLYYELPALFNLMQMAKACQDTAKIKFYRDQIKALVKDCGCGTSDAPKIFVPTITIGDLSLQTANSITGNGLAGTEFELINDVANPGATKLYGTDALGVKGWFDQPVGGGGAGLVLDWTEVTGYEIPFSLVDTVIEYRVFDYYIEFKGKVDSTVGGEFDVVIFQQAALAAAAQNAVADSLIPVYSGFSSSPILVGYIRVLAGGNYSWRSNSDYNNSDFAYIQGIIPRQ